VNAPQVAGGSQAAAAIAAAAFAAAAGTAVEASLLQQEMQRLLQDTAAAAAKATGDASGDSAAGDDAAAAEAHDLSGISSSSSRTWDPFSQLYTAEDALDAAAAEAVQSEGIKAKHPLIAGQQLFSAYVHSNKALPFGSLFAGCELSVRLNTSNGW
jgi:hypothetical protein